MAPYFVQLREMERRLLRDAIAAGDGDIHAAAALLGVTYHYIAARAKLLGGVINGEPKHEPPGLAAEAFNAISRPDRGSTHEAEDEASTHEAADEAYANPQPSEIQDA